MTSDPNDRATEQEETMRQAAIQTSRKPEGPKANGCCLYCNSPLPRGMRWCGSACQQDYTQEQEQLERSGRR